MGSTVPVTVDDMIHHGKAVVRGTQQALDYYELLLAELATFRLDIVLTERDEDFLVEGRQGIGARTVLASPLTAAASAVAGRVADPRPYLRR